MTIKLYTAVGSGNAYKVELMLRLLSIDYEPIQVNLRKNDHRKPEFLTITPFGQIPVLLDDELILTDSQAILCYLARSYGGTDADQWFPTEPLKLAQVMRWLSVSANEIQNGPTYARSTKLLGWPGDYDRRVRVSYRLLKLMNVHLNNRDWLATDMPTVADIACYPYIFLSGEGGIDHTGFRHVASWLKKIETIPGFWPIPRIPNLQPVPMVPPPQS